MLRSCGAYSQPSRTVLPVSDYCYCAWCLPLRSLSRDTCRCSEGRRSDPRCFRRSLWLSGSCCSRVFGPRWRDRWWRSWRCGMSSRPNTRGGGSCWQPLVPLSHCSDRVCGLLMPGATGGNKSKFQIADRRGRTLRPHLSRAFTTRYGTNGCVVRAEIPKKDKPIGRVRAVGARSTLHTSEVNFCRGREP
jgi:hypothetical protein